MNPNYAMNTRIRAMVGKIQL